MRTKSKRILAYLLTLCLTLPSLSCRKSTKPKQPVVKENDPYFLSSVSNIRIDPGEKDFQYFWQSDETIIGNSVVSSYEILHEYPGDLQERLLHLEAPDLKDLADLTRMVQKCYERGLVIFDFDGNPLSKIELPFNSDVRKLSQGRDGEILCFVEHIDFDTMRTQNEVLFYSMEGLLTGSVKIPEEAVASPETILDTKDGKIVLGEFGRIDIISEKGELLGSIEQEDLNGSVVESGDKLYAMKHVTSEDETGGSLTFCELDLSSCTLKDGSRKIDTVISDVVSGGDGKCYSIDGNGIRRIDPESGKLEEVLNWNSTDVNYSGYDPDSFRIISEDKIAFLRTDYETDKVTGGVIGRIKVASLSREEKNPHAGKKYIEMGTIGMPSDDLLDYIVRYNTTDGNTSRIRVRDYSTELAPDIPYLKQQTILSDKVYKDMLAGTGPDILVDFSCFSQFNSEDVLIDLNKYVDGADGLNREEYFDNVLSAFENKGKLFQIPVCFDIRGLLGNRKMTGERSGWTYSEFQGIVDTFPEDVTVIEEMEYNVLLERLLTDAMMSFVDYTKKDVYFDGDEFSQLLKIVKQYGVDHVEKEDVPTAKELPVIDEPQDMKNDPETRMNEGKLALMSTEVYNLYQYADNRSVLRGNAIYLGMPSPDGTGVSAMPALTLAISAFSGCQDEAWAFIRRLFDEDSQYLYTSSLGSIPLHRKAFDRINEDAIAENQMLIEQFAQDQFVIDSRMSANLVRIKSSDAVGFKSLIENASTIMSTDPAVLQIIEEEADAYFHDRKSLEEVCSVIQERTYAIVHER